METFLTHTLWMVLGWLVGHFGHDKVMRKLATARGQTRVVSYRPSRLAPRRPKGIMGEPVIAKHVRAIAEENAEISRRVDDGR